MLGLPLLAAIVALGAPAAFLVLSVLPTGSTSLPEGWTLKQNRGAADFVFLRDGGMPALRLRSNRSSFGLERAMDVDPGEYPLLTWRWKVTQLPAGGDFRRSSRDDQAAQVLVAFADRRILAYIWDTSAPKGTMQSVLSLPLLHIYAIVCQSGPGEMNRWLNESRNLPQDYRRAYNRTPPHVRGIRIQINSQHTSSSAESYFSEITLRPAH